MSIYRVFLVGCIVSLCTLSAVAQKSGKESPSAPPTSYRELFKSLMGLEPDARKVARVSGTLIQRDVGTFMLDEGTLTFCRPVAGRVCAAVFEGKGSFNYMPPTEVERMQLQRVMDKQALDEPFTTAIFLFADSTYEELSNGLSFSAGAVSPSLKDGIEDALKYISDESSGYFDPSIVRALLNGDRNDLFYACFYTSIKDPIFFNIDPYTDAYNDEEVQLLKRGGTSISSTHETDIVNSFHRQAYYLDEQYNPGVRESIDIEHYVIDATIAHDMGFSSSTNFQFTVLADTMRWINLTLTPDLKIDSMTWGNNMPATYEQTGAGTVWVRCDKPMKKGEKGELKMKYAGEIIERYVDYFYLPDPHYWYPHHSDVEKATFDLKFHTPSAYKFASIGERISSEELAGTVTSRWVIRWPVRNASFNIGICKEHMVTRDTIPAITVYMARVSDYGFGGTPMDEQVGEDIENSCMLFQHIFGRSLMPSLYATEIHYPHGEAFPGLVHLYSSTFEYNDESGWDHYFRAHETAHQWWGIGVDFKTYHDQWLSEAFATYSGLLYLQAVRKDNDKFFKMLDRYRESILSNRNSIFLKGREAGPIWLGYRTSTSATQGDYDLIVYRKGAWVLHMLRNMLLDMNTMKEDKFFDIMRDFYTTYKGSAASTEDFRRVVEKHVGLDMGWFFREWIYGTAVPSYRFAYKVADPVDGRYKVTCRVEQSNVPDDFQMYVPIKIDFGDGKLARLRVLVQGKSGEFDLPLMPMKPEEIVFNDLNSVLCEVDNVSW
jgi:hypothetical protein